MPKHPDDHYGSGMTVIVVMALYYTGQGRRTKRLVEGELKWVQILGFERHWGWELREDGIGGNYLENDRRWRGWGFGYEKEEKSSESEGGRWNQIG